MAIERLQEINLAHRVIQYLMNCQRDLRLNAASYLAEQQVNPRPRTAAALGAVVRADGVAVSAVLAHLATRIQQAGLQAKLSSGLAFFGLTLAEANQLRLTLKNAADAQAAAQVNTDAQIAAAANATLAAVPIIDVID